MNKFSVLIVDDEPLICDELRCILADFPDFTVREIAYNVFDADIIVAAKPLDVIFLDIHMPGMSGLEWAKNLAELPRPPLVVFVTAYSDFAVDAFAVNAVDYILKPFDQKDIARVVKKVRAWRQNKLPFELPKVYSTVNKLCVEAGDRLEVIDVSRIQVIQADDRQVFLRTVEGQTYGVKRRLNELEQMLDGRAFYRCHRNYIVNINEIRQVANWFNRGYLLIMKAPPAEVPVGRVYAPKLRDYLLL